MMKNVFVVVLKVPSKYLHLNTFGKKNVLYQHDLVFLN